MVHDFVNRVKGVFLVDNGVEQDAERPDILFFAAVGGAAEDFWGCVVCEVKSVLVIGDVGDRGGR